MTARQIIRKELGNSKNFLTPHIIRYGKISKNIAYELSAGDGIFVTNKIYGVTIVSINEKGKTKRKYKLSNSFGELSYAEEYIKKLKRGEYDDKSYIEIGT